MSHQSLVRSVDATCHGLTSRTFFDLVGVLLESHSFFLGSTNTHFCLQVFQKLFKSAVNSESVKITSHPEVFSRPASETRNQSKNKEAMITWIRAPFVHEDIKFSHQTVLRLHSTLAQSWDCSLAWYCSNTHATSWNCLWLQPCASSGCWCGAAPVVHHAVSCVSLLRGTCVAWNSPDQGFLAFQSPHQLIETSLHRILLHTSFL